MFNKNFLIEQLLKPLRSLPKRKPLPANEFSKFEKAIIFWPKTSLGILFFVRIIIRFLKIKHNNVSITLVIDASLLNKIEKGYLKNLLALSDSDILTHKYSAVRKNKYDLTIIPSFWHYSIKAHFFALLTKSKIRIGVSKINEMSNPFSSILDFNTQINWIDNPDMHYAEILLNIIYPIGYKSIENVVDLLKTNNTEVDLPKNISGNNILQERKIIFINNQSEDLKNRWGIENLVRFISKLVAEGDYFFFYVEDEMDNEVKMILEKDIKILQFINKNDIINIVRIIKDSNLVVTCNSDIMHIAGLFNVPQISIFGMDNPFILSPLGPEKKFLRGASGLIDEISGEEVYKTAIDLLEVNN